MMRKSVYVVLMILIAAGSANAQTAKLVQENYDSLRVKEIHIEVADSTGKYVKQGEFVRWYEDGSRWMEGRYENGLMEGDVTEYREDLTRKAVIEYHKDKKISQALFGSRGFVYKEFADTSQFLTRLDKFTAPNGQYVHREGYDSKKQIFVNHGKAMVWASEGGPLYEEGIFQHGRLHGMVVRYYPDGKKEFEGTYKEGRQDGVWLYWDKLGKLEKFSVYVNDTIRVEMTP